MVKQKPTRGVQLNLSHPLARGLKHVFLFNELSGDYVFDLITRQSLKITQGTTNSNIFWQNDTIGSTATGGTADAKISGSSPQFAIKLNELSVVAVGVKVTYNDYTYGRIIAFQNVSNDHQFLCYLTGGTGDPDIRVSSYVNTDSTYHDDFSNTNSPGLLINQTNDFAWTWKSGLPVKYYKNGAYVADATNGVVGTINSADTGYITIFNNQDTGMSTRPFGGSVQAIYVFNRTITAAEVAFLYENPYALFESSFDVPDDYWIEPRNTGPLNVYYAVCPGTGGTSDKKTGSPTISITSGVATLSVVQTGNIGQGFKITYDSSAHSCYISSVIDSTHFNVVTATGETPPDHTEIAIDSITADYASLSDAEAGAGDASHMGTFDLTGAFILNLVCYAGVSADSTDVTIDGYTTSSSYYIKVYAPNGSTQSISNNRHSGAWDETKYYRTGFRSIYITDNYTRLDGLQVNINESGNWVYGIRNINDANVGYIENCILKYSSTSAYNTGIDVQGASEFYVRNCIVYGWTGSTSNGISVGYDSWGTLGGYVYNCTVFGNYVGINSGTGAARVRNCAVFNNTDDFLGSFESIQYCASDDADGTNAVNISPGSTEADDWAKCFVDYANGDYRLAGNSVCLMAGQGPTANTAISTTDIAGNSRAGLLTSIGAFHKGITDVYYSLSPFGTADIKTGSPQLLIEDGVASIYEATEYFGNQDVDGANDIGNAAITKWESFTCPGTGTQRIVELSCYCFVQSGQSGNLRLAVYSNDRQTLIAQGSAEIAPVYNGGSYMWQGHIGVTNITPNPATLTGGTDYQIALSFDSAYINIACSSETVEYGFATSADYTGGFPTTLGSGTETAAYLWAMRCGVAELEPQTGNIGQGCKITYDTSKVVYIKTVTDSTHFVVVDRYGVTPPDITTGTTVNSIAHNWASLSAAESGADDSSYLNTADLTSANCILNLACYYDHDNYTLDTTYLDINGFTTSSTQYINIYAPRGLTYNESINNQRHSGVWDANKYALEAAYGIIIYDDYVIVDGLQLSSTGSSNGYGLRVQTDSISVTGKNLISKTSGTNSCMSFSFSHSGISYLINCIGYGNGTTGDTNWTVGNWTNGSTLYLYNCTFCLHAYGIVQWGGTVYATNCISFNHSDDLYNATCTYCAIDDSDSFTGKVDISPGSTESDDWAAAFTDYANGDFRVKNTSSVLYDAGTSLSSYFTTDIAGTTRSTWDIGAFEYTVTLILTFEGFRFRNDDGTETTATWIANQDTDIYQLPGNNLRFRGVIDAVGSGNVTPQLEFRTSTDGNNWTAWTKVS